MKKHTTTSFLAVKNHTVEYTANNTLWRAHSEDDTLWKDNLEDDTMNLKDGH